MNFRSKKSKLRPVELWQVPELKQSRFNALNQGSASSPQNFSPSPVGRPIYGPSPSPFADPCPKPFFHGCFHAWVDLFVFFTKTIPCKSTILLNNIRFKCSVCFEQTFKGLILAKRDTFLTKLDVGVLLRVKQVKATKIMFLNFLTFFNMFSDWKFSNLF